MYYQIVVAYRSSHLFIRCHSHDRTIASFIARIESARLFDVGPTFRSAVNANGDESHNTRSDREGNITHRNFSSVCVTKGRLCVTKGRLCFHAVQMIRTPSNATTLGPRFWLLVTHAIF